MEIIGARVRSLREYKGWSQEDLAHESELQRPHISLIENNERTPGADTLTKLADALGTNVDYLLGRTDNPAAVPTTNHPAMKDPAFAELASYWPDFTKEDKDMLLHLGRRCKEHGERMRQQQQEHPDHSNHF